jgi:hypothetical protein
MSARSSIFHFGQSWLILAIVLAGIAQPILAAPKNEQPIIKLRKSNKICQQAINFVEKDLRRRGYFSPNRLSINDDRGDLINPQTIREANDVKDNYYDYPPGRTDSVTFVLTDSSKNPIDNFYSSPRLMTNLAAEVISSCNKVGLIWFHYYEERGGIGYFPDGTVRIFNSPSSAQGLGECGEFKRYQRTINTPSGTTTVMKWGYQCLGGQT